mgnify:CR=1 FL=1
MLVSRGEVTLNAFFFLVFDNRARASIEGGFSPTTAYDAKLWESAPTTSKTYADESDLVMSTTALNGYRKADSGIAVTLNFGTMTDGAVEKSEFYSSLDPDLLGSIDKIKQVRIGKFQETSSTITAKELDPEFQHRLVSPDNQVLSLDGSSLGDASDVSLGWYTDGELLYENLTQDTTYRFQALEKGNPDAGVQKVTNVTTAINPIHETKDGTGQTVTVKWEVYPEAIRFADLDTGYRYALLQSDRDTIEKGYVQSTDGSLFFAGLEENTTYYLVAKSNTNSHSDQIAFTTTELDVSDIVDMPYTGEALEQQDMKVQLGIVRSDSAHYPGALQSELLNAAEYTATYTDNVAVGTAKVTVTVLRDGTKVAEAEETFQITAKEITIVWENTEFVYDGNPHRPDARLEGVAAGDDVAVEVTGEQTVSDPSTASDVASEQPAVTDEPGTEAESRQRTSAGRSGTGSGAKALGPGDRAPRSEQYPIFSLRYPSRRLRMDVREDLSEARAAGALRWSPETAQGSSPLFSMIGR